MNILAIVAVLAVCAYYAVAWSRIGRDPKPGAIVPQYEPPRNLSPALLRFIWKEGFDDRGFWAGTLSLVSQGFVKLESVHGETFLHGITESKTRVPNSKEEELLLSGLNRQGKSRPFNLLDPEVAKTAVAFGNRLRLIAIGKFFNENRSTVVWGSMISLLAIIIVANPPTMEEWGALLLGVAVMAPGAFGATLLSLRIRDIFRSLGRSVNLELIRRVLLTLFMLLTCMASVTLGFVVLLVDFGWALPTVFAFLVGLNLGFLHLMKAPTEAGRKLLDEIEGFRLFLNNVEKMPLDRPDAPSAHGGLYERYLPYAVALEVEQGWCDKFVAIENTAHLPETYVPGAHSFYLGMWNGKPIEISFVPQRSYRGY